MFRVAISANVSLSTRSMRARAVEVWGIRRRRGGAGREARCVFGVRVSANVSLCPILSHNPRGRGSRIGYTEWSLLGRGALVLSGPSLGLGVSRRVSVQSTARLGAANVSLSTRSMRARAMEMRGIRRKRGDVGQEARRVFGVRVSANVSLSTRSMRDRGMRVSGLGHGK